MDGVWQKYSAQADFATSLFFGATNKKRNLIGPYGKNGRPGLN